MFMNAVKIKRFAFSLLALLPTLPLFSDDGEKTTFQTAAHWKPATDVRADVVMVYGTTDSHNPTTGEVEPFEMRVQSWRDRGYRVHFMTGIAWGDYQDYFTGQWDGCPHLDEGQKSMQGDTIWHGYMVPYIVPSDNYIAYFCETQLKRAIDAGIDAIFLEEPEYWAHSGYSEAFQREWHDYYGFDWLPQHESAEGLYLSGKLKYVLYQRALQQAFTFCHEYGRQKGMNVRCYVPTHSLLNYSMWGIVSPEASLASIDGMDGYIAQVWTGTSRSASHYNGVQRERVFETAFLEYGCMESMTAPTGRKMFFLTDPIEDQPKDWEDYRRNYQATFTAQLLYPSINNYEVMPWPDRIYQGLYRVSAQSDELAHIPSDYATRMQVMVDALRRMPLSTNKVSGTQGVSVLMANSLMFQRAPHRVEGYDDPGLSDFFGLSLPLLKRGIPVGITHIENVGYDAALKDVKVLLMTYSNMKPLDPSAHGHLAAWVQKGGCLIYAGRDDDPFCTVREWWNTDGNAYRAPSQHLFEQLGLQPDAPEGMYSCGKGWVYVLRQDPKDFVLAKDGDAPLFSALYAICPFKLQEKNHFRLDRGPYTLAAVMDESPAGDKPLTLKGLYIDLYDHTLPVLRRKVISPGQQALLYAVRLAPQGRRTPQVLASASRQEDECNDGRTWSFVAKSPADTQNVMRLLLPRKPVAVTLTDCATGQVLTPDTCCWDRRSHTLLLAFPNSPNGIRVVTTLHGRK